MEYFKFYIEINIFLFPMGAEILLFIRSDPEVRFLVEDDGVEHSVWPVKEPETVFAIQEAFESVSCTYIADGHHRSASAFR